jgi:hypothetical protein
MTQRGMEHLLLDVAVPATILAGIIGIFAVLYRLY